MAFEEVQLADVDTPTRYGRGRSMVRLSTGAFCIAYVVDPGGGDHEIWVSTGLGNGTGWVPEVAAAPGVGLHLISVSLAVDSANNLHLLYEDDTNNTVYYCTKPFGGAWSAPFDVGGADGYRRPVIAVDATDNIVCVYVGTVAGPGTGHCFYHFCSSAGVWGVAEQADAGMGVGGWHDYPTIAFDSVGNLHIVTQARGYGVWDAIPNVQYMMRSPAGVYTQIAVTDVGDFNTYPAIAIGLADAIHLTWLVGGGQNLYATKALAAGAFGAPVDVGIPEQLAQPSIAVDRLGVVYIVGGQDFGG
jgi:hypothetical protein